MNYFRYCDGKNTSQFKMVKIFNAVQNMKQIAIARYGVRYQDALDAAFFHIIDNYDDSFDEEEDGLERYTASIVSTIYRSHSKKEVLSDTVLDISSNTKAVKDAEEHDPFIDVYIESNEDFLKEVDECVSMLLPNFLKDYEVFKTKSPSLRKMNYSKIYSRFNDRVLGESVKRLCEYYEDAKYLGELGKTCRVRAFPKDRYLASLDDSVRLVSIVNGIAVCSVSSSLIKRNVFRVLIEEFIDDAMVLFYSEDSDVGYRKICGHDVYCSPSGRAVIGVEEIRKSVEYEIVGSLLAKVSNIKVIDYKEGESLLVSSSKAEESGLWFELFGVRRFLEIKRIPVRRVVIQ